MDPFTRHGLKAGRLPARVWWTFLLFLIGAALLSPGVRAQSALEPTATDATASYGEAFEAEKEWLVVELLLDEHRLSEAFLVIWDAATEKIYVPAGHLAELLELAVNADAETALIEGWVMSPERAIFIDLQTGRGQVSGRDITLTPEAWMAQPDDLYVAAEVLEDWLPIAFLVDLNRLRLRVEATEPLPIHRRLEREKRLAQMRTVEGWDGAPHYEVLEAPYRLFGAPVMDLFLNGTLRSANPEESLALVPQTNAYNIRGAGDLLWMQGNWSVSGAEHAPLSAARLNLSRRDPSGRLLGALGATHVELGDVHAGAIPLVATGRSGRGASLSTAPLTRAQTFDRTSVRGQIQPGWEVELYRNGAFMGTTTESAGTFEFPEVPLVYGWNELRLVFFGPYGQEREEIQRVFIGSQMVPVGEGQLDLQVQESGAQLLPLGSTPRSSTGGVRAMASYEHGLSSTLSVLGRATTASLYGEEQRNYVSGGARVGLGSWYLGGEAVADVGKGVAGLLQFQTRQLGLNFAGHHLRTTGDFRSTALGYGGSALRSETNLRVDGALKIASRVPYQLEWRHRDQVNGYQSHRIAGRYGLRLFGAQFTHRHQVDVNQGSFNALTARAQLRRRIGAWTPTLSADYRVMPQPRLRFAQAGVDRKLGKRLMATASLSLRNLVDLQLAAQAGIQGELSGVRWGFNAGWGQRGGWALGVSLAMGIGPDPVDGGLMVSTPELTQRGAVVADIFRDANGNGTRDPGEASIEGARVMGYGSRSYREETGTSGRVKVDGNPSHYTELRLDTGSLDDPFAVSTVPGRSITTRPGAVAILELPVVIAGEVDGTLFVERDGHHLPLAGGCVTLRPRERPGKTTPPSMEVRTAYDGFFYFPHVPPGSYELGVCRPRTRDANFVRPAPQPIFVGLDGTVIAGRQIVIGPNPRGVSTPKSFPLPGFDEVAGITPDRPEEMSQDHRALEAERRAILRARSQDTNTSRVRIDGEPTQRTLSE